MSRGIRRARGGIALPPAGEANPLKRRLSVMSACIALGVPAPAPAAAASARADAVVTGVTTSPAFFNPSLGQHAMVAFSVREPGQVALTILDRDRFAVRSFPPRSVGPGKVSWAVDGQDDQGAVLPDEAYSIRLEFTGGKIHDVYDPSKDFVPILEEPKKRSYSAPAGTLSYTLTRPARVHVQAGQASLDAKTGRVDGPVLKTVVDRLPRPAGSVVEHWDGFSEGGGVLVPVLPHFATSIVAMSLPEASLLLVGNRKQTLVDYARRRRPAEAVLPRAASDTGAHHAGLNAFEDRTPGLRIEAEGERDADGRLVVAGAQLPISVSVDPDGAGRYFFSRPTEVQVFLDEERVFFREMPDNPARVLVDVSRLGSGEHRLAVNWLSRSGPVGVRALKLVVPARVASEGKP